jgi:protein tyrosine phosphatase domain-containing protein 1
MGKLCKHENFKKCANPAIIGLHSEWVVNLIIGSQRLSDRLIHEYDIITQFKDKGVKAIFNLEEPGEHPYCGDGIIPKTGFSYTPELLMRHQV